MAVPVADDGEGKLIGEIHGWERISINDRLATLSVIVISVASPMS